MNFTNAKGVTIEGKSTNNNLLTNMKKEIVSFNRYFGGGCSDPMTKLEVLRMHGDAAFIGKVVAVKTLNKDKALISYEILEWINGVSPITQRIETTYMLSVLYEGDLCCKKREPPELSSIRAIAIRKSNVNGSIELKIDYCTLP